MLIVLILPIDFYSCIEFCAEDAREKAAAEMSAYKCLVTSILQSNTHYKHYVVNSNMLSYFAFGKVKTDVFYSDLSPEI
jgi:hypothetical protein